MHGLGIKLTWAGTPPSKVKYSQTRFSILQATKAGMVHHHDNMSWDTLDTTFLNQALTNHNFVCWTKTAHATNYYTWVISFFLVSGMPSGESSPSLPPITLSLDNARCNGVTPRRSTAFTSVPEYRGGSWAQSISKLTKMKWTRTYCTCFQKCSDHSDMMCTAG